MKIANLKYWELEPVKFKLDEIITLKEIREGKNITQREAAEKLGISKQYYSEMEQGKRTPGTELLHKMAGFYGTSMDFLYHAIKKQSVSWTFPDAYLMAGKLRAVEADIEFLKGRRAAAKKL
jgi:transcriptional regulator with XRE-family HTH domain